MTITKNSLFLILLAWTVILGEAIHAEEGSVGGGSKRRKIAILPFQNLARDPNLNLYSEALPKAMTGVLKEFYSFQGLSRSELESIAAENNITDLDELFNKNIARLIGLQAKQDIVIAGAYQIIRDKDGGDMLQARVYVLDIQKNAMLKEVTTKTAMAERETMIETIADDLVRQTSEVFASKQHETLKTVLEKNAISVGVGYGIAALPKSQFSSLSENSGLLPADAKNVLQAQIEYRRFHAFWNNSVMLFRVQGQFATSSVATQGNDTKTDYKYIGVVGAVGMGYLFSLTPGFLLMPAILGGYHFGSVQYDFSGLTYPPLDSQNKPVSATQTNLSMPAGIANLSLIYQYSRTYQIELANQYQMFLGGGKLTGTYGVQVSLTMRWL
jgi:hypothetical protein